MNKPLRKVLLPHYAELTLGALFAFARLSFSQKKYLFLLEIYFTQGKA